MQILNRFTGSVITEGDMSLRELVLHCIKSDANLRGADLRGANLRDANLYGADLRDADLRDADLRDANLYGADLCDANLYGADLCDANLCGANLYGADLRGADYQGVKIKITAVFTGLYKYIAMPVIGEGGTEYIRLGCHFRTVAAWQADFWNNPGEFPNTGDMASKLRWLAYQTCLSWLEINRETP